MDWSIFCKEGSTVILKNNAMKPIEVARNELDLNGPVYGIAVIDRLVVLRTGTQLLAVGG